MVREEVLRRIQRMEQANLQTTLHAQSSKNFKGKIVGGELDTWIMCEKKRRGKDQLNGEKLIVGVFNVFERAINHSSGNSCHDKCFSFSVLPLSIIEKSIKWLNSKSTSAYASRVVRGWKAGQSPWLRK